MISNHREIRLSELIAPPFYKLHDDIKHNRYTHYFLKGGRGSTKSSFVSLEIIIGMMRSKDKSCVVFRKVGAHLKDSVYAQLCWAAEKLGVADKWEFKISPLEMRYKKTGQRILFRGADNPQKLKSIKVGHGYIGYIWYEEADQFDGMREIRNINQSLMRGGEEYAVFYSYNPPVSVKNWLNIEVTQEAPGRRVHHSTYLDVPAEWLGELFMIEAEHLKRVRQDLYRHEYMGEAVGTGGEVFTNVTVREISSNERKSLDRYKCGVDFGYASDPFVYVVCALKHERLYIMDEIFKAGLTNRRAAELIEKKDMTMLLFVTAPSLRVYGNSENWG